LDTMRTGLIELSQHAAPLSTQQLASSLYVLFGALESNLKATFGDGFDQKVEVSKSPEVTIEVRCSFCGKARDEVEKIIAGAGVFICNKCVSICNEVLSSDTVV
jgi:ClpX C4-type zinc finger protein